MDYGHDLRFGSFLTPDAAHAEHVVALAQLSEDVGLDLVTIQDHPYQARFLDTWTLLSVIGARTRRVQLAPNVANLPLRPAAVLARSVASLDLLTGGRVELGLGAGGFFDAIAAIGGPRLSPAEAVDALSEGIDVIRALWSDGRRGVHLDGRHHRLAGAHPGPAPAHDVGIWIGSYGRRMLRLTGTKGDGWLPSSPYAGPDELDAMTAVLDDAARAAGRDPAVIVRSYNVAGRFDGSGAEFLTGPPSVWVEQLTELALESGISGFILMTDAPDDLRRFAAEVVPGVRELVAAERAGDAAAVAAPRDVVAAQRDVVAPSAATGTPFATVATPDDGVRMSAAPVWDESTRPSGPGADPRRRYTAHEQAAGRHLVDVHDMLRAELGQVRDIVAQVVAGRLDVGTARSDINTMTMRQNNWTAGVYCAQYCRVVTTHHGIEDASMFPHLRRADPALAPVLDRLEAEHRVIHDVLDAVDRALVAFVSGADGVRVLQDALDALSDALLSHLSYEERELVEPLARLGFY